MNAAHGTVFHARHTAIVDTHEDTARAAAQPIDADARHTGQVKSMATTDDETVLEAACHRAPAAPRPLHEELAQTSDSPLVAALRALGPLDPAIADAMERAIEEDCERVDVRDW